MAPGVALADAGLIVLDRSQLPFDLGPGHPSNSPARAANSPNSARNSSGNTANSPSAFQNRPNNPENHKRLIFTGDGNVIGYYTPSALGVLNLFDTNGRRVGYRPASGTSSIFAENGEWCGTVDRLRDGSFMLAVTAACAARFNR